MKAKEIAKFASGFAADQLLTHGAMAVTDTEFRIFGIQYTSELNTIAAVIWAVVLALLVFYAWGRRSQTVEC